MQRVAAQCKAGRCVHVTCVRALLVAAAAGDLKGVLRRAAEEGRQLEEGQIWSYLLQASTDRAVVLDRCVPAA